MRKAYLITLPPGAARTTYLRVDFNNVFPAASDSLCDKCINRTAGRYDFQLLYNYGWSKTPPRRGPAFTIYRKKQGQPPKQLTPLNKLT